MSLGFEIIGDFCFVLATFLLYFKIYNRADMYFFCIKVLFLSSGIDAVVIGRTNLLLRTRLIYPVASNTQ